MITAKELYSLLKTLNIPVAYDHFENNKTLKPPFMVYREVEADMFKADGITYFRPYAFEIELVTEKKDFNLQEQIEGLLTNNKIPFDTSGEVWDEDEKIYHNFYNI